MGIKGFKGMAQRGAGRKQRSPVVPGYVRIQGRAGLLLSSSWMLCFLSEKKLFSSSAVPEVGE